MSFAVWKEKPPFTFAEGDPEQLYQVGSVWVVTDDPSRATQAEVDKALNASLPANSAAAFDARQRDQALQDLDRVISQAPADQQPALRAIQQLLKD